VFPVRYGLDYYILLRRNSVSKGLIKQFYVEEIMMSTISGGEFLTLGRRSKMSANSILYRPFEKIHFPLQFQVISNIFLFSSW
jgi:hypothetical protein